MGNQIDFGKDDILYRPFRPTVYSRIEELAKEFAVLGKVDIASRITDLLLSHHRIEHGFRQLRFLNFAFEQTGDWPSAIPESSRSKNALEELEVVPPGSLDKKTYDELINRTESLPEDLALCLNIAVVLCEEQGKKNVEDMAQDEKVVRVLEKITEHFHYCISALIQYRKIWPLLASGIIAQQLKVDDAKLCAAGEDVVETVRIRMEEGRQKIPHGERSTKELLQIIVENTRENAGPLYEESCQDPPKEYLHNPAKEKDIEDMQERLQISGLPDDYKEFLLASNGLESVYDGTWLTPPLHNTQDVVFNKDPWPVKIPFELVQDPSGTAQMPREYGYDLWPSITNQIEIGELNDHAYILVDPSDVKATIQTYKEALASDEVSDAIKVETIRAIEDTYGSMEAFEKLEWVMMEVVDYTPSVPIGTFQNWLEETVRLSSRPQHNRNDNNLCLAYKCR